MKTTTSATSPLFLQEEMQRFLIQAKQDGYHELFLLELGTGLRLGEILALQWDDLNMETGRVAPVHSEYAYEAYNEIPALSTVCKSVSGLQKN